MLQATPVQMVSVRDMILNTLSILYCKAIRQQLIDKNNKNKNKNKNRKPHRYEVHDKILVHEKRNKYEEPYKGPYQITKVWKNRTVAIFRGAVQDCINIIWINPITNNNKIDTAPVNFN